LSPIKIYTADCRDDKNETFCPATEFVRPKYIPPFYRTGAHSKVLHFFTSSNGIPKLTSIEDNSIEFGLLKLDGEYAVR